MSLKKHYCYFNSWKGNTLPQPCFSISCSGFYSGDASASRESPHLAHQHKFVRPTEQQLLLGDDSPDTYHTWSPRNLLAASRGLISNGTTAW